MSGLAWNTKRVSSTKSRVYGGWHYWLDGSQWKDLDAGFQEDSGRYVANRIPGLYSVPELATGSVDLEVSQQWDIFSKSRITDTSWSLEITPENVSPVSAQRDDDRPDQIVYPNAFADGVDLRYTVWLGRAPRVTREISIRKEPPGDHDLRGSWLLRSSRARVYVRNNGQIMRPWSGNVSDRAVVNGFGVILRAGVSEDNESLIRGSGIRAPKAWYYLPDGTMVSTDITVEFEIVSPDTVRATKIIPRSFVREAFAAGATAVMSDDTSTFYPDPNTETTCVDGQTQRASGVTDWPTIRDGVGTYANDSSTEIQIYLSTWFGAGQWHTLQRGHILFDTSSLTGRSVTSATLGMTPTGTRSNTLNTSWGVALCATNPASNTAIVSSDHQTVSDTRFADTDVAHANPMSGVKTWDLNTSGLAAIDVDGISKFGLRHDKDLEDVENFSGTGRLDYAYFYSADQSGTASDPYLEVTHELPSAGVAIHSLINGGLIS